MDTVAEYVIIDQTLTDEERKMFLDTFIAANPSWKGALVADVLAMLVDSDARLDVTEPTCEALGNITGKAHIVPCALVVLFIGNAPGDSSGFNSFTEEVKSLVNRVVDKIFDVGDE